MAHEGAARAPRLRRRLRGGARGVPESLAPTALLLVLLLFAAKPASADADATGTGSLDITVTGVPSPRGTVHVAVYASPPEWLKHPRYDIVVDVHTAQVTVHIDDIPPGRYSVASFHDANRNDEADRNLLGIPTEAYGFSRDAKVWFGPPRWRDACFNVVPGPNHVYVHLK